MSEYVINDADRARMRAKLEQAKAEGEAERARWRAQLEIAKMQRDVANQRAQELHQMRVRVYGRNTAEQMQREDSVRAYSLKLDILEQMLRQSDGVETVLDTKYGKVIR